MELIKYEIKYLEDCWGCHSYFGYKNGKQYTEAYDNQFELMEQNPEFRVLCGK